MNLALCLGMRIGGRSKGEQIGEGSEGTVASLGLGWYGGLSGDEG